MSIVFIKTNKLDITHEDQEQQGLKFEVLVLKDGIYYIKVSGDENNIANWKTRVNGQDSSLDETTSILDLLPNSNISIKELQNTVAELIKETLK